MRQTLFYIPESVGPLPVFGWGLALILWAVFAAGFLLLMVRRQGWSADTIGYIPALLLVAVAIVFVLPHLDVAGQGIPIRGYGVMLLMGITAGVALSLLRARQMGVSQDHIYSLAFWLFLFGIAGARLFFVIQYWDAAQFSAQTWTQRLQSIVNLTEGGLVVYGSLIGGMLAFVIYCRRHRLPLLAFADLVAPALVLGLAFGRIGCLLNGCCFGGVCELPWAVTFPASSPPYQRQVELGLRQGIQIRPSGQGHAIVHRVLPGRPLADSNLKPGDVITKVTTTVGGKVVETTGYQDIRSALAGAPGAVSLHTADGQQYVVHVDDLPPPRSLPAHPTQIYSSINAALIFCVVMTWYPLRRRDGETILLLLTLYAVTRFLLEVIRTDESAISGTGLTISQNVSVLFAVALAGLWIYVIRQPRGSAWPAKPVSPAAASE